MLHPRGLLVATISAVGFTAAAQVPQTPLPAQPPAATAGVGRWDAALVERAAKLVASPGQWNRLDTGTCRATTTFSIACALEQAVEESAGINRDRAGKRIHEPPRLSDCRFDSAGTEMEGTCGVLFDELPVFTISRAKDVATGKWRPDMQPEHVWSGRMSDAEYPVMQEAAKTVSLVSSKGYSEPLKDYNNDPATTFADVQAFFRQLQDQVLKNAAADMAGNYDDVEIELYAGGTGVMRTYAGWYPVSAATLTDSTVQLELDAVHEVTPNGLDRQILQRADAILASEAVWNRADNRKCAPTATTWSIYCAEERASIDVTGGFHHRRPALELVRQIVDERTEGKKYHHRLMDYNNDPATHLADVRSLFAEAIARIK